MSNVGYTERRSVFGRRGTQDLLPDRSAYLPNVVRVEVLVFQYPDTVTPLFGTLVPTRRNYTSMFPGRRGHLYGPEVSTTVGWVKLRTEIIPDNLSGPTRDLPGFPAKTLSRPIMPVSCLSRDECGFRKSINPI